MRYIAGIGRVNCDLLYGGMPALPEEGTEVFSESFDLKLGGGVPAVMVSLHRLGVPVRLSTFLGKDQFSAFAQNELKKSGVPYENLYTGDKMPVTVTSVMITKEDRTFASYQDEISITKAMEERIYETLSGASIACMHIGWLDLFTRLKKEKPELKLILDFGWDSAASVKELEPYFRLADYYTPNLKEALKITGASTPEAAADVLSAYFEIPVIKLGGEGCLVRCDGENRIIPPLPDVKPVDATGAGDAFFAGFLYGLYHEKDILSCVRYGNVMGGRCVENIGCLTSYVSEEQLLSDAGRIG